MSRRAVAALVAVGVIACAGDRRRFAQSGPMWRDTDLEARAVPCRRDPKRPDHRICRPEEYESSFDWDGADNIIFRPIARFFAMDPSGEAVNVNSFDETPDSSWFTNRIGVQPMAPDEVARGSCDDDDARMDIDAPDGSWVIDSGKANGANPGFRIRLADGRKYMLKPDTSDEPERATGATTVAARLYHAAGWFVACDQVLYIRPSLLKLTPGIEVTDNTGVTRKFDQAALDGMFATASKRGDRVRVVASRWLPGRTIGPFTYAGVKDDDPGDIIPHEQRRDLRGARLMAAWTDHFDTREQNTLATWMADDPADPDSSPGRVIHYYIDLGDCFGSKWPEEIWKRLGHAYYLDFGYLLSDFVTLGLVERPWDRARRPAGGLFGYFSARDFDPERWRGGYPNPTFNNMTERDGAWAARIIARFSDEQVAAAARAGDFTDPAQTAFLTEQLIGRRDAILRRYLARLSPVTDLAVSGGALCGVDLARRTHLFPEPRFTYRASLRGGGALEVRATGAGGVCVALPRVAGPRGEPGYLMVDLHNGQATGTLRAHVYDLGPELGHRLVGIERLEGSP